MPLDRMGQETPASLGMAAVGGGTATPSRPAFQLPSWKVSLSPGTVLTCSPSIREGDLWDAEMPQRSRCLLSARLFPVLHAHEALGLEDVLWLLAPVAGERLARWRAAWRMSWQELLPCLDRVTELGTRRDLFFLQGQHKVRQVLLGCQDSSLLPLTRSAVHEGYHEALLGTLDEGELDLLCVTSLEYQGCLFLPTPSNDPLLQEPMGVLRQGGCKLSKSPHPLLQKWAAVV